LIIQPSSHDHSYLHTERRAGTPVVFVDRPPSFLDADAVVTDNAAGIRGAVRHLVEQGHRRIAYLGDMRSIATAAERHQGYVEELAEQKIGVDATLVRLDLRGIEKAEAAAREVLARSARPRSSPARTSSPSVLFGRCAPWTCTDGWRWWDSTTFCSRTSSSRGSRSSLRTRPRSAERRPRYFFDASMEIALRRKCTPCGPG